MTATLTDKFQMCFKVSFGTAFMIGQWNIRKWIVMSAKKHQQHFHHQYKKATKYRWLYLYWQMTYHNIIIGGTVNKLSIL